MAAPGCTTAPLVEAARDGRLGERELASLDRHLAACAACRALRDDLERLASLVRVRIPAASPLERQRGRSRLLREAALVAAPAPRRRAPVLLAVAAAALAAGSFGIWRGVLSPSTPPETPVAASAAALDTFVHPAEGTRYARSVAGGMEVVSLETGSLDIGVRPHGAQERFIVRTGDAEIEVRGTRLRIAADAGRLRSIDVVEGSVDLSYAGAVVTLDAGASWRASDVVAVPTPALDPEAARDALPAALLAPTSEPDGIAATGAAAAASPSRPSGPTSPRPAKAPRAAGADAAKQDDEKSFAEGVALIERGDYGAAAERLNAFEASHPADTRSEDAAFLTIVALQRAGQRGAAAKSASAYLARYPKGYRRAEVEAIAARR